MLQGKSTLEDILKDRVDAELTRQKIQSMLDYEEALRMFSGKKNFSMDIVTTFIDNRENARSSTHSSYLNASVEIPRN